MTVNPTTLLLELLRSEIQQLNRLRDEAKSNQADFDQSLPSTLRDLRGIAGNLADIYQGAENCFQRIARVTQEGLPSGLEWHRQLLDQMSQEVPRVRPRVLRPETRTALEPYRSFRHLARHLYGFDLKWPEMQPLLLNATSVIEALVFDLEQFCTFLEQLDVPET